MREIDPVLPIYDLETMREIVDDSLSFRQTYSILIGLFALVSFILALGGVYGVISYVVSQRRNEIGIRIALGAEPGDVRNMVMRQSMATVGVGLLAGAVLESWNIRETGAVGDLVFNLIKHGLLEAGEDDTPEQFVGVFSFDDGFHEGFESLLEDDPPRLAARGA